MMCCAAVSEFFKKICEDATEKKDELIELSNGQFQIYSLAHDNEVKK